MNGDQVKAARAALGLSQAEFAALIPINRVTLAKLEGGKPVSEKVARRIGELSPDGAQVAPIAAPAPRPVAKASKGPAPTFSDPEAAEAWSAIFEFPPEPGAGDVLREMVTDGATWPEAFMRLLNLGALAYRKAAQDRERAAVVKVASPDRLAKAKAALEAKGLG